MSAQQAAVVAYLHGLTRCVDRPAIHLARLIRPFLSAVV